MRLFMFRHLKLERPLAILDLETTGVNVEKDRIVEISVLRITPGGEQIQHTRRLNPEMPIPPEASLVHGIRDGDVMNEPTFSEIAYKLQNFLEGCDLCGFNLKRFDMQLLYKEFQRVGLNFELEGRSIIDPMLIFHQYERRDLAGAVKFYLGREHKNAHTAAADVQATAQILEAMLDRYQDLPRNVPDLHLTCMGSDAVDSSEMFVKVDGEIRFRRGKYRGATLEAIARDHPDYLDWMVNKGNFNSDTLKMVADSRNRPSDCIV